VRGKKRRRECPGRHRESTANITKEGHQRESHLLFQPRQKTRENVLKEHARD
jgi:hypothetical protein